MFKRIKRYFRKSVINVNYELKYEKEIEKHEKTKIKLSEANDRIRFLEKELDRNYQNGRILYLQKIIRRKNEIIENLDNIYTKSKYLERPNTIQGDNQFNNKQFRDYCNGYVRGRLNKRLRKIHLKISIPYRHRQQAHIERLNQTIGQMIFLYQTNKELQTKKQYTEWHEHIRTIIDFINDYKLKDLNKNYEKEIKIDNDFVFNKKTKYTIREGTKVKVLLDTPQNIFGDKLPGKHRKSDIYWSTDNYIVLNCIMLPGNPPLYKVKNLKTGEIPNALYTNEQLQII